MTKPPAASLWKSNSSGKVPSLKLYRQPPIACLIQGCFEAFFEYRSIHHQEMPVSDVQAQVTLAIDGPVAVLTLNRPARFNAIDPGLLQAL